jgi:hypothetical protein
VRESGIAWPARSVSTVYGPIVTPRDPEKNALVRAVERKRGRNRAVLIVRTETDWPLVEIGLYFGITRERVRQIASHEAAQIERFEACRREKLREHAVLRACAESLLEDIRGRAKWLTTMGR